MSVFAFLLAEVAAAALSVGVVWALRRWRPWVFLLHPVVGFFALAALHGLAFFSDGTPSVGGLFGFGVVFGLFLGVPLGLFATAVAFAWYGVSRAVRREPNEADGKRQ